MTDEKLKALAEKATPGPWHWHEGDVCDPQHNDVYLAEGDAPDAKYMIAACNETPKLLARIAAVEKILSDEGCTGKCAHGACCVEKACEECGMEDEDDWCLACLISVALKADDEAQAHD